MSMSYSMRHAHSMTPAALAALRAATAAGAGSSGGVPPSLALGGARPPVVGASSYGASSYGASSAAHGPPAPARGGSGNGSGNAFLGGSNLCMLALCEVAQVPSLAQPNPNPNPDPNPDLSLTPYPTLALYLALTLTPNLTLTPTPTPKPYQVPSLKKKPENAIWVAPDEDSVVTRFLFVFPHGLSVADHAALRTANDDFTRQVRACIEGLEREAMSVQ